MSAVEQLITDNLDIWSSAIKTKSASGRGTSKKLELYGIKKLRELILELAVRGLLVPQDPNDEPASELLKKIAAEKAKLVKEGKIKKQKPTPQIKKEDKPFDLPKGWEWVRLREIGHDWGQKQPDTDFTYIDVGAINKELGIISEPSVLAASAAPSRARKIVKQGTVIYSTVRPYLLNIAVVNEVLKPDPIASTAFAIIHPFDGILASYIYRYLRSPAFINYVEECQTGIAYPAVNDKQFFSGVLPLPPTAEQHRIVAKVDELMALCDQLEQQQESSIVAHQTLVKALLDALTTASERDGFAAAWARIADHFDTLFTTEWSIDQLKQTILQLAVMGKLVPQDPNDEPASELLKKIAAEKAKLVKEGKIKKQKTVPPIEENEMPFVLPEGWGWSTVQELSRPTQIVTYGILKPVWVDEGVATVRISEMGQGVIDVDALRNCDPGRAAKFEKTSLIPGDLLITKDGTIGKTAFVPPELAGGNITQHVLRFSISETVERVFIRLCIDAPMSQRWMAGETKGVALKGVNVGDFRRMPLPVPPLKEQKSIVAKVDELMALCDTLKTCLNTAQTIQLQLAGAMAERAVA